MSCYLVAVQVQVFVQAWTAQGKSVVEKLRSRTFCPKQVTGSLHSSPPPFIPSLLPPPPHTHTHTQLEEVKWRLNLQMAQSSRSKMKAPNALFEFVVKEGEVSVGGQ